MILTVFLIYIYQRQNRILERQQDIMESEEEISEASQVAPNIHVEWSLKQDGSLELDLTNTGADDAYHVTVHTNLEVLEDCLDIETQRWNVEAFRRVIADTEQNFLWNEEVRYKIFLNEETYVGEFRDVTEELMKSVRNTDLESVKIRVLIWLSYEDIRGEKDEIELLDSSFEINGRTKLSASHNTGIEHRTLLPRIRIVDTGVFKHYSGVEYFGIEFESIGESTVDEFSVFSEVEVFDGSEWVSADRFGFSGGKLKYYRDEWLLMGEFLFKWCGEELFFDELSELLLDKGFNNRVLIRFRIQYVDATGNSGTDAVGSLCNLDFGGSSSMSPTNVPVVSKPCNLYELL
jgi:hypothetical protein